MTKRNMNLVHYSMHKSFFDNLERERKKIERRVGVGISQSQLTEILAKGKIKFRLPKQKKNFMPKISMRFSI